MHSLNRKHKLTWGTETPRNNLVRHKKECSVETAYKKSSAPDSHVTFISIVCYKNYPEFSILSTWKHSEWFSWYDKKVDPNDITNVVDGTNLEEMLHPFQHFLVDSETERARNRISFEALAKLNTTKVGGTVDHFFKNSKFALMVNKVFGIILKKEKNEDSDFFYAHEKKPGWIDLNWCQSGTTWRN